MKRRLKKLYRKLKRRLAFWIFRSRIYSFGIKDYISNEELENGNPEFLKKYLIKKMVLDLSRELHKRGYLDIEERNDFLADRKIFTIRINIIK